MMRFLFAKPHLCEKHAFSLLKSPRFAKITPFLFENPPLKRKSRVFSLQIPHLCKKHAFSPLKSPSYAKITRFLFANPPFNEKHMFSLRKPPTYAKITRFLFRNLHLTRRSRVFSSQIPHLSENYAFSLCESPI